METVFETNEATINDDDFMLRYDNINKDILYRLENGDFVQSLHGYNSVKKLEEGKNYEENGATNVAISGITYSTNVISSVFSGLKRIGLY